MAGKLTLTCTSSGTGARYTDGGRPGLRHLAIGRGGPADPEAMAAGNTILEQLPESTALELTLSGGTWRLSGKGQIALTGAEMNWRLDGARLERYQTVDIDGTHELSGGFARSGCRAYLCIRGHWSLPSVRGSVEPGLPGTVEPKTGEPISIVAESSAPFRSVWRQGEEFLTEVEVAVHPGPEWYMLDSAQRLFLEQQQFVLDAASDRQGLRLNAPGNPSIEIADLLSSPVVPGTVQWTPSGLILLGPDAQTVGGYMRVLVLASLPPELFQLRPGGKLRFAVIREGL